MDERGVHYDLDEWDCLYCELVKTCPYGKAVMGQKEFCRLQASCPERIPMSYEGDMPPEIEQCLLDIYGCEHLESTDELRIFLKIHN